MRRKKIYLLQLMNITSKLSYEILSHLQVLCTKHINLQLRCNIKTVYVPCHALHNIKDTYYMCVSNIALYIDV